MTVHADAIDMSTNYPNGGCDYYDTRSPRSYPPRATGDYPALKSLPTPTFPTYPTANSPVYQVSTQTTVFSSFPTQHDSQHYPRQYQHYPQQSTLGATQYSSNPVIQVQGAQTAQPTQPTY